MNLGNKLKILGLCFLSLIFNFSFANAQENDLFLVISPFSPSPGKSFSIEAKSFIFDTSRASFKWLKNGKRVDEGTGITKKIFEGEKLGSQINIVVAASSIEGKFYETRAQIGINDIDFIINPLTYTPSFYRGQSLPTPGSIIQVYAIPHIHSQGSRISSSNLIFEWKLDGNTIKEQSGRGKNKFIFSLSKTLVGENEISLKVSSLNGTRAYEKTERVRIQKPEVVLYKTSTLVGKSPIAILSLEAKSNEDFAIIAEPFFFDFNSLLRSTVSWLANGAKISTGQEQNPFILELSSPTGTEFENNISFKVEDEKNVFQKGEGKINIKIKN